MSYVLKEELAKAKQHLQAWLEAELAVSTGQAYKIGTRQLTRASLADIREQIKYWKKEIQRLENSLTGKKKRNVFRFVPRDL